ncbi:phospho-N-acetylmuramoyl-pentapeptide-transferase [Sinanaerobacter sp. ZZT-01]|uniref:phospho-N-acetylmuramoyl-pentapeptide- transferase n=1 Tax=Sinanaerobacter sp. ZZT-01 TaxID=3111540 RepID=UPI002D786704|nr:phospho-N-acetylmuramoyl-pentapeptide-transferase [Sinanaerobacter sp. ZZT-01]WRR93709.1 phospho-N-acetylmuramoyl-pentapeptide-transferase [Sinanaerobacter sp. ZZT-01]
MEYIQIWIKLAVAFLIAVIGTPLFIPVLKRIKAGQSIREEGPQSHMVKTGTPTMGGIVIIFAVLVTCISSNILNTDMWILLSSFIAFGLIGFIDDFVKVAMKRNLGLTALQKLLLQIAIAVGLAAYQSSVSIYKTTVFIPFINEYWDFGIFYIPFIAFVVVSMVNSVNLTDGLDGLASGVTSIVALFFALVGMNFFGMSAATVFCAALAGGCLGFLMYNKYPAKLFMGDTGSLALGGGLAAAAILMNIELILPIAGGVYVAEALSVIIQVGSYKLRNGKRVFRMAPLHHHFELGGWKETKIVVVFWIVTLLLCIISLKVFDSNVF